MNIYAALGLAGVVVGLVGIGWCAHWYFAPHIENYRHALVVRRLRREIKRLHGKVTLWRMAFRVMERSSRICHAELNKAESSALQAQRAVEQMHKTLETFAEDIDPGGRNTEPL